MHFDEFRFILWDTIKDVIRILIVFVLCNIGLLIAFLGWKLYQAPIIFDLYMDYIKSLIFNFFGFEDTIITLSYDAKTIKLLSWRVKYAKDISYAIGKMEIMYATSLYNALCTSVSIVAVSLFLYWSMYAYYVWRYYRHQILKTYHRLNRKHTYIEIILHHRKYKRHKKKMLQKRTTEKIDMPNIQPEIITPPQQEKREEENKELYQPPKPKITPEKKQERNEYFWD